MSASRDRDLLRLLKGVATPVYVVDDQRQIVFVNDACAQWLGIAAAELVGRVCRYQSAATDRLAAAADALCPPPEALGGRRTAANIARLGDSGVVELQHAEFIPLGGEGDANAVVLAVIDLTSRPNDAGSAGSSADASQELHDSIRSLRYLSAQRHRIDRLAGSSAAIRRIRAQIELAASGRGAVLIVGPAGCGGQDIARTIHFAQAGAAGAFTPISCSALPAELLLSTMRALLERYAQEQKAGATLLLVDVDTLAAEVQAQVARWVEALAGNIRVMATSQQDLDELAEGGGFWRELATLLGTLVIEVPPLGQRREDIPLLAQLFLEESNEGTRQLRGFTSEALDRLAAYDWPGDVDELAGMVREACAVAESFEVTVADLPKQLRLAAEASRVPRKQPQPINLEKLLGEIESELINRALREAKGNKSRAARLLGLTRPRLYRRMVQSGLAEDAKEVDGEGGDAVASEA